MPTVRFTQNIQRHVSCPPGTVVAITVADALQAVFTANPAARSYVLDDQGLLRKHMMVFINGEPVQDRARLSDTVAADAEIYVMQALSGG